MQAERNSLSKKKILLLLKLKRFSLNNLQSDRHMKLFYIKNKNYTSDFKKVFILVWQKNVFYDKIFRYKIYGEYYEKL